MVLPLDRRKVGIAAHAALALLRIKVQRRRTVARFSKAVQLTGMIQAGLNDARFSCPVIAQNGYVPYFIRKIVFHFMCFVPAESTFSFPFSFFSIM